MKIPLHKFIIMKRLILSITLTGMVILAGFVSYSFKSSPTFTGPPNSENEMNALIAGQQEDGWIQMFDGKTTNGWRGYNKQAFPEKGWKVENGTLRCMDQETGEGGGGDIIYDTPYKDFDFTFEWKISEAGNSGVFYLAKELPGEEIWHSAPEFQVLDNERHPDANQGKDGNRKAASLYDLIPANPQNAKPAGEWNTSEIVVNQGHVTHYMNGEKVVEYQMGTPEWDELVAGSKFNPYPEFGKYREGYIGLQDHSNDVWYRNLKIKPLQ